MSAAVLRRILVLGAGFFVWPALAQTAPAEPLNHVLKESKNHALEITVDATAPLRKVPDVGGVSFHMVGGPSIQPYDRDGNYTLPADLEGAIRDLRLPATRFYGLGDIGYQHFDLPKAIDLTAAILRKIGVGEDRCTLEFEQVGIHTPITAAVWAAGVRHSVRSGYGFHSWEIVNEPYSYGFGGAQCFANDPALFIRYFKEVSEAVRKEDPRARIGLDILRDSPARPGPGPESPGKPDKGDWSLNLITHLAGHFDFVAPHYYAHLPDRDMPFERAVLTENYRILASAQRVGAWLRTYTGGRAEQRDTEWGLALLSAIPGHSASEYEIRNGNIEGAVHRAVRLIYYAREPIVASASSWCMLSSLYEHGDGHLPYQGYLVLSKDAPARRSVLYWLHYYFNRCAGERVLAMRGTAPYFAPPDPADASLKGPLTPALATLSKDGSLVGLVLVNGSWTGAVPCRVHVEHAAVRRASAVVLSQASLDAPPLLARKEDAISEWRVARTQDGVSGTLPPHSVVFVLLSTKDGPPPSFE